jgi:peptidoglycan hydrolase-like protein with peptidoglycan-binding domain
MISAGRLPPVTTSQINFTSGVPVIAATHKCFVVPVPAFSGGGEPLVYPGGEPNAGQPILNSQGDPIGTKGIVFWNAMRDIWQGAPGDGTTAIVMNEVDETAASSLYDLYLTLGNPEQVPLEGLRFFLNFSTIWYSAGDIYVSARSYVRENMSPVDAGTYIIDAYGETFGHLKVDAEDSGRSVYISDPFKFQGPVATAKSFQHGGVLLSHSDDDVRAFEPEDFKEKYLLADGSKITDLDSQLTLLSVSWPNFNAASMPTLEKGTNKYYAVLSLQFTLNNWRKKKGLAPIGVYGGFGTKTLGAVKQFQSNHDGLDDNGKVDFGTWQALEQYTAIVFEPREMETFDAMTPANQTPATQQIAAIWQGVPGTTSVSTMQGNGGRPVVVHLPDAFNPDLPARAITMFHGHGWNVGQRMKDEGVLARLQTLQIQDPQTLFVFPESVQYPFSHWLKGPNESFAELHREAFGVAANIIGANKLKLDRRIVDVHSGSGLTLVNAIKSGELVADKLNLLDSAYGDWAQRAMRWALKQPHSPRIESWHTNHSSQAKNNKKIAKLAPNLVTVHSEGSVSEHNNIPGRYFGTD